MERPLSLFLNQLSAGAATYEIETDGMTELFHETLPSVDQFNQDEFLR